MQGGDPAGDSLSETGCTLPNIIKTQATWGEARIMNHLPTTAAESPALDAGQPLPPESSRARSCNLSTQVISFAISDDQFGVDIMINPYPRILFAG